MISCICGIAGFVFNIALACILGVEAPEACSG